jgi:hypothetical protein
MPIEEGVVFFKDDHNPDRYLQEEEFNKNLDIPGKQRMLIP